MPNFPTPENNRPRAKHTQASTIYHLPPTDMRQSWCDICGCMVLIQFRDAATGHTLGLCCLNDLRKADAALRHPTAGTRHPSLAESKVFTN